MICYGNPLASLPTLWLNSSSACQEAHCEMRSLTLLPIALPDDLGELQPGLAQCLFCFLSKGSTSGCCRSTWFSLGVNRFGIFQGRTTIFHSIVKHI